MKVLMFAVLLSFGLALSAAYLLSAVAGAEAVPDGELALDCDPAPGVQPVCTVPSDLPWSLTLHIVAPPVSGYVAWQVEIAWPAGVTYAPSADPLTEGAAGAHCQISGRFIDPLVPGRTLHTCVPLPAPASPLLDTGPVLSLAASCQDGVSASVALVEGFWTAFVLPPGDEAPAAVTGAGATVTCRLDVDQDGCRNAREVTLGLDWRNGFDWGDLNHNGSVDAGDIALVVAGFGTASPDRTGDGRVSAADISAVAAQFGRVC